MSSIEIKTEEKAPEHTARWARRQGRLSYIAGHQLTTYANTHHKVTTWLAQNVTFYIWYL